MSLPDDHPWNPASSSYVLEELPPAYLGAIEERITQDELGTIEAYWVHEWPDAIFPDVTTTLRFAGAAIPPRIRLSNVGGHTGEVQRQLRTAPGAREQDIVYLKVIEGLESQDTLGRKGAGGALFRERGEVVCTISCYRRAEDTYQPRERASRYVGIVKNIFHQITLPTSREIERSPRKRHSMLRYLLPDNCQIRFDREFRSIGPIDNGDYLQYTVMVQFVAERRFPRPVDIRNSLLKGNGFLLTGRGTVKVWRREQDAWVEEISALPIGVNEIGGALPETSPGGLTVDPDLGEILLLGVRTDEVWRRVGTRWVEETDQIPGERGANGLAMDPQSRDLFVAGNTTQKIWRWERARRRWVTQVPDLPGGVTRPQGLTIDPRNGDILLIGAITHQVHRWSSRRSWEPEGNALPLNFGTPQGLAVDPDTGILYTVGTSSVAQRIFRLLDNGNWEAATSLPTGENQPTGLAFALKLPPRIPFRYEANFPSPTVGGSVTLTIE